MINYFRIEILPGDFEFDFRIVNTSELQASIKSMNIILKISPYKNWTAYK